MSGASGAKGWEVSKSRKPKFGFFPPPPPIADTQAAGTFFRKFRVQVLGFKGRRAGSADLGFPTFFAGYRGLGVSGLGVSGLGCRGFGFKV